MKKLFMILFAVLLCGSLFGEVIQEPRQRVSPEDFSIMPWGWLWSRTVDNDVMFREMYECGFNLTTFINADQVKYAKKYHLGAVVQDWGLDSSQSSDYTEKANFYCDNIVKKVGKKNLSSIYQVYVQDEPGAYDDVLKRLASYSEAIRKKVGCRPYINLFPNYANSQQLGKDSYQDYLDYFVKGCKLDYISYDHYAFSLGAAPNVPGMTYNEGGAGFNENGFYGNLEAVREAAIRNNVRFINIIQSVGALHWPDPDDYIIHVQGWSTLAYGAGGISYFTLYTPNLGNWREAPYGIFGEKTPTWRYVRNMNYAIHNVSKIYKTLESVNVFHMGNVPQGCNDISSAKCVKTLNLTPVNGTPNVCVGEFKNKEGKEYAIVVNKDPRYSVAVSKIEFNKGTRIMRVEERSFDPETKAFSGEDVYIAPGHGMIFFAE
ncbi:MAG: hypothetical protein KBT47_02980 [Armatimonadetes bacterium]|nr:hypothetical protein [Candidatus Hippobium faecium]